jgi:hypothetical protein
MYGTFLAIESPLLFKQNLQKILEWINLIFVSDLNPISGGKGRKKTSSHVKSNCKLVFSFKIFKKNM